jgi:hypothetical protein
MSTEEMSHKPAQLTCGHCARVLEFSGERPRFCAYCGRPVAPAATPALDAMTPPVIDSEAATAAPKLEIDSEAATAAPPPASPGADDDVPETVGGYRLVRRLGGGGMGSVYEAEEPVSGRRVALKLVLPEYAESPDAVERFRQEGRLASSLAHPRCVFVLAADEDAGRPYIAMELMPGSTLDDLVKEKGPLSPEEAVRKILDVIDGLREAHQLGLVHRDVKPSNCFLEADGRVKVGDFGLAKSLVTESKLTRTGSFLGTPLYAAPEQIKMERVDAQSDLYSVAATLYFLLTGRAPFQSGDAMATLARIVSDDPPPMRSVRPELPKALDRVVLRGLERDRRRRWRDLDEFRKALVQFLPAKPSVGGLGLRFAAWLIDGVVLYVLGMTVGVAVGYGLIAPATRAGLLPDLSPQMAQLVYRLLVGVALTLAYYGVLEGLWGWSVGKRLLRLRVGRAGGNYPPGVGRAALRAGVLLVLFNVGPAVLQILTICLVPVVTQAQSQEPTVLPSNVQVKDASGRDIGPLNQDQALLLTGLGCAQLFWLCLAVGLTVCTLRARTGYRALHEVLSGTRTYRLRWPQLQKRRAVRRRDFRPETTQPEGIPERVGPFRVRGALRWAERERALLAEDAQLGRQVWLWLRPATEAPLEAKLRDVSRHTRVRWVGCGRDGDWQWDAFLAPSGAPLPAVGRLSWADARPILEDLADELAAACADGTLPPSLTPQQVWVEPDGHVRLLAVPPTGAGPEDGDDDQRRALCFLGAAAVTTLEARPRPPEAPPAPVRAPLPPHAAEILDRLLGAGKPYATVERLQADLEETRDRPAEVTRLRRAGHLALMVLLLHIPFFGPTMLMVVSFAILMDLSRSHGVGRPPDSHRAVYAFALFCTAFWVVWAFLFRGGYAFWRGGIVLRRADGRKAWRLQCAFRALLVWAPVAGLLCLAALLTSLQPDRPWLSFALWGVAVFLLLSYVPMVLWSPARGPHDRLAGTYLMPP